MSALSETNNNPGESGRNRAWPFLVGLPVIVALAVAAVILLGGGQDRPDGAEGGPPDQDRTSATEQAESPPSSAGDSGDTELGSPSLGDPGAPVVMVEYSDYQ